MDILQYVVLQHFMSVVPDRLQVPAPSTGYLKVVLDLQIIF